MEKCIRRAAGGSGRGPRDAGAQDVLAADATRHERGFWPEPAGISAVEATRVLGEILPNEAV
jgi:hypothetical protein